MEAEERKRCWPENTYSNRKVTFDVVPKKNIGRKFNILCFLWLLKQNDFSSNPAMRNKLRAHKIGSAAPNCTMSYIHSPRGQCSSLKSLKHTQRWTMDCNPHAVGGVQECTCAGHFNSQIGRRRPSANSSTSQEYNKAKSNFNFCKNTGILTFREGTQHLSITYKEDVESTQHTGNEAAARSDNPKTRFLKQSHSRLYVFFLPSFL